MSPYPFNDADAYERYMGRWSRAAGAAFLTWLSPPAAARWLDVGCGTGAFTECVFNRCHPALVSAIDPSEAQIGYARTRPIGQRADLRVADARSLPYPSGSFDIVVSALVIGFIPDRRHALAEMRRVCGLDGIVAAYVWDLTAELAPNWPLRRALRQIGCNVPPATGTDLSSPEALRCLFEGAGLEDIANTSLDVTVPAESFDEFWRGQTARRNEITAMIAALPGRDRTWLKELVRTQWPERPDGMIAYAARASAIKGRVTT